MKKTLLVIVSLLFLLIIGLLVGPSFIDWNKYKPQIIQQAEQKSGYKVNIAGDISLAIIPSPRLKIEGLSVEAPRKVKFENLLTMKSVQVGVEIAPLLRKEIAVDHVKLIEPVITLEKMKDGKGSWVNKKMEALEKVKELAGEEGAKIIDKGVQKASSSALDSIALNSVMIENGSLTFIDHQKDQQHNIQDINTTLKAKTLKGPYDIVGALTANDIPLRLNLGLGAFDPEGDSIGVNATVSIPKADSAFAYDGIVGIKAPFDVQGQTKVSIKKPAQLAALIGESIGFNDKVELEGLVTAGEDKIEVNDLIAFVGDARAQGKISVQNFKQKNPVSVAANLKFNQAINLGDLSKQVAANASTSSSQSSSDTKKTKKEKSLIPSSLTLPMPIDAKLSFDTPGIIFDGKEFKGVFVALDKKGANTSIALKALGLPGQGKAEGKIDIAYGSSSVSPASGAVTYADPSVSFVMDGYVGQFENAMNVLAPQIDKKTAKLFKSARFDLKGSISPKSVSLKDSVLKLDDSVIGIGGRYTPALNGGRASAIIDISATDIDLDRLTGKENKTAQASTSSGAGDGAPASGSGGSKGALKPLQEFSLPLDLGFDVSVQKLRVNGTDIKGVRLTGDSKGNKLVLKNASVNDYQGAALSAKGEIANRADLSGLDLTLGLKTQDIQSFAKTMKMDASKLPSSLKSVDGSVTLKGAIDALSMAANVKAMRGQLDVAGKVKDALGQPQMDNMVIGLKHPNLSEAIKIVSSDFKGNAGLAQPINFSAKASTAGKVITLSDMKTVLGKSSFNGGLKIDQTGPKMSVSGALQAGTIALDELLGAKSASKSSGGGNSSSGGSPASSSKERWSKSFINVDWMNNMNVDLDLSANAIQYGAWNFIKPSTKVKIQSGILDITGLKAGVFGGNATLNASVKAPEKSSGPLSLNVDSQMSNISLEALAFALSKSKKLQSAGTVSFNFDVNSVGPSAHALINALNGKAALNGKDIILEGFDLNKMARGLAVEEKLADSVSSLVDGATSGGQTKFDTLEGSYKVSNGVVNIESMVMESDVSRIDSTGFADLPKWTINTDHKITLKEITDLEPFTVKIKGPLDNPSDTFGKNVLEDYLGAKLKRKLAKELPDILGDDVSNTLQQFGIIPKEQKQVPANDNAPVEAEPQSNVAPQKEVPPAQKKIEKPEDALNQILNSDNPEDAVKDVLKGLF